MHSHLDAYLGGDQLPAPDSCLPYWGPALSFAASVAWPGIMWAADRLYLRAEAAGCITAFAQDLSCLSLVCLVFFFSPHAILVPAFGPLTAPVPAIRFFFPRTYCVEVARRHMDF